MSPLCLPPDSITGLESLASGLGLPAFDLLLLGDGSGTVATQPAGWACVAYDRRRQQAVVHAGAVTAGTNNYAELAPYVQALWSYQQDRPPALAVVNVQIVSDSEVTVRCGEGRYARRANACLWAAVAWFEHNGYRLAWHHVRRNSNPWAAYTDGMAGQARRALAAALGPST